jgi:hypothetical protein
MNNEPHNPPAYPQLTGQVPGMKLRDAIFITVLPALINHPDFRNASTGNLCKTAWGIATEALRERPVTD